MDLTRRHCLAATATFALTACAGSRPLALRPTLPAIGIYSAGQGSAFLPYAQGVAAYLTTQGLKAQALESSGSIQNLQRVDAEPDRLGCVFLGSAHEGVTGTGAWTQGRRLERVRALFPMYETSFQIVALRASGLGSLPQLAGKRVGVGPAGGPAESFFNGLAQATGLRATVVTGTPAALAADVLAGRIDALWQGAALPIPAIRQVADAADAVVFGLAEGELAAMLQRFPFLSPSTLAAGTYRGQSAALRTVAAWNFVVAHRDLPAADAEWITRTVLTAPDPASTLHASAGPTRAENARHNTVVPFHPGALRVLRELGVAVKG